MTVARIECQAGASGDMFLGAWIDLGAPWEEWTRLLSGLSVGGYEVARERVMKRGIASTKVHVRTERAHAHRHLPQIERIITDSDLPDAVRDRSLAAFRHLAEAEAAVHATTPERIHFHEVGAVDAIVDIVGSMIAWHLLGEPECAVSPIQVGGGEVECAHGIMPVPAPATARLLQGYPTYSSGVWGETTTPTGAAIIRTLAQPGRAERPFVANAAGYGAGTRELPIANVLRIQLGDWADSTDEGFAVGLPTVRAVVIEANVDDMNPEIAGFVLEHLLGRGAMDAYWTPLVMKKGRPALRLSVLCSPARVRELAREVVRQTSSIGLRYYAVDKWELPRSIAAVPTIYGEIRVKTAELDDAPVSAAPEFEDCRRAAQEHGAPIADVYQAALAAWRTRHQ